MLQVPDYPEALIFECHMANCCGPWYKVYRKDGKIFREDLITGEVVITDEVSPSPPFIY
jgi:hypothetical protein